MAKLAEIDTPAVVVDMDRVERNIGRVAEICTAQGLALRPHIKTHRSTQLARRQIEAGASGITCQKLGEVEVMASAGIDDILITFNIVGTPKLLRLRQLHGKVASLQVTIDNEQVAQGLSAAFADAGTALRVLVECDTGAGRCGVQDPKAAAALACVVDALPGLEFAGLMTYPLPHQVTAVDTWLAGAKSACEQAELPVKCVSCGGSPDLRDLSGYTVVTEYRVGTYVYNDRSMVAHGCCGLEDCALTVLATVVSTPAAGRAIVDAGSKMLSSDLLGQPDHGEILGAGDVRVAALSEEHGHLQVPASQDLQVGDRVRIIPNHACVVSNLVEEVVVLRQGETAGTMQVQARGCST